MKPLPNQRSVAWLVVSVDLQSVGGIQEAVRRLLKEIHHRGDESRVFSLWKRGLGVTARLVNLLSFAMVLVRLPKTMQWTVVITVTGFDALVAAILCRFWDVQYVIWEHGRPDFFERQRSWRVLAPLTYRHARAVVVLSEAFANGRHPAAHFRVIPNFLHSQTFDVNTFNSLALPRPSSRVFWIGRSSPEKRPELGWTLLESLSLQEPSAEMLFVSDRCHFYPNERSHSRVRWVNGANLDVQSMLTPYDVVLMTSVTEAMPMVLFEALCAGSLVVASECTPWVSQVYAAGVGVAVPIDAKLDVWTAALQAALHESPIERLSRLKKIPNFLKPLSSESTFSKWMSVLDAN
jgi:glycosyltransferase involved in cell wall biosynthesis